MSIYRGYTITKSSRGYTFFNSGIPGFFKTEKDAMNRIDNLNHTDIKLDILLNIFKHLTEDELDTIEARVLKEIQQDKKEDNPIETDEERQERIDQDSASIQRVDAQIKR